MIGVPIQNIIIYNKFVVPTQLLTEVRVQSHITCKYLKIWFLEFAKHFPVRYKTNKLRNQTIQKCCKHFDNICKFWKQVEKCCYQFEVGTSKGGMIAWGWYPQTHYLYTRLGNDFQIIWSWWRGPISTHITHFAWKLKTRFRTSIRKNERLN